MVIFNHITPIGSIEIVGTNIRYKVILSCFRDSFDNS